MNKLDALLRLVSLAGDEPVEAKTENVDGYAIVVADRGHVWVGTVSVTNEWVTIDGARTIRQWGTTEGLNELAVKGPLSKTKLDAASLVRVSRRAVIALIPTDKNKWTD